jgi:hypothetical protein
MTVLLCGSSQTHLGTKMPSGGGHIINAQPKEEFFMNISGHLYSGATWTWRQIEWMYE